MSIDIDRIYSPHFLKDTHFWMSETFMAKRILHVWLFWIIWSIQSNHKVPYKRNSKADEASPKDLWRRSWDRMPCCPIRRWREKPVSPRLWDASLNWKDKEADSYLEPQGEKAALSTLIPTPFDPRQFLKLQNCEKIFFVGVSH